MKFDNTYDRIIDWLLTHSVWVDPQSYNEMKIRLNQHVIEGLIERQVKLTGM